MGTGGITARSGLRGGWSTAALPVVLCTHDLGWTPSSQGHPFTELSRVGPQKTEVSVRGVPGQLPW